MRGVFVHLFAYLPVCLSAFLFARKLPECFICAHAHDMRMHYARARMRTAAAKCSHTPEVPSCIQLKCVMYIFQPPSKKMPRQAISEMGALQNLQLIVVHT